MKITKYTFTKNSFEDYLYWQKADKNTLNKINTLLKSISRDGVMEGVGKPEKLKGDLSGYYSRRITIEHRLVYRVRENAIEIVACRFYFE